MFHFINVRGRPGGPGQVLPGGRGLGSTQRGEQNPTTHREATPHGRIQGRQGKARPRPAPGTGTIPNLGHSISGAEGKKIFRRPISNRVSKLPCHSEIISAITFTTIGLRFPRVGVSVFLRLGHGGQKIWAKYHGQNLACLPWLSTKSEYILSIALKGSGAWGRASDTQPQRAPSVTLKVSGAWGRASDTKLQRAPAVTLKVSGAWGSR